MVRYQQPWYLQVAHSSLESLVRDRSMTVPSPPRAGNPQTQARFNLDTQSQGDPGFQAVHTHTHTHRINSTPMAAAANANQESARERGRERIYLHLGLVERLAVASHDCESLLTFWRGDMYRKPDNDSVLH